MAYWRHRTKTGHIVYDRPPRTWRVADLRRIQVKLRKPYVVLPESDWTALFNPKPAALMGELGWFNTFLIEEVESVYLLEGSEVPGIPWTVWYGPEWRRAICATIEMHGYVTIAKSEWIE
ncbi:unnamed protein product [marine sediment metagenome]|uniref:Uncharacterized protein n=1 Tax=marine sediment metagenome TaxID=412755 RepID=X1EQL6_9ZZZZ